MKNLLILLCVALLFSCGAPIQTETQPEIKVEYETYWKVIKAIKEKNITTTDYEYKPDWLNGELKQQPVVSSTMKYFLVFTDGTSEETTMEQSVILSVGDSVLRQRVKTQ